jgi:hypothetical protein
MRVIAPLIAAALVATAAGADTVAGWDFSQYRGDGDVTGAVDPDTLPANYSDLDTSFNAGADAATYGTLYFDGSNGSTSSAGDFAPTAGTQNCLRRPTGGSLEPEGCAVPNVDGPVRSNRHEPWASPGKNSFDSHTILKEEGQTYASLLGMTATDAVDAVFKADLGTDYANFWRVSFGGKVVSGGGDDGGTLDCDPDGATECTTSVEVWFSDDGSSYDSYGTVDLTAEDQRFSVDLEDFASPEGYVRLSLGPGGDGSLPIIDNVAVEAIPVPEPGTTLLLVAGVVGLLALPRR